MMALVIVLGVVVGVGLTLLISPLLPHQLSVKSAMANLKTTDSQKLQQRTRKLSSEELIGSWVMEHLPETKYLTKFFTVDVQNLNILAIPELSYWYRRFNCAVGGAAAPLAIAIAFALSGDSISVPLLTIFIGAGAGWMLYNQLH